MVFENQILNRKIVFVIFFLKIRKPFLNNLKLAVGINRVSSDSSFLP